MASFCAPPSFGGLLARGRFIGRAMAERYAHGFGLAHHASDGATVAEHQHEEGHFIFVTSGEYVSRAAGKPSREELPFLYNPPGIVHDDCFKGGAGTFFAISVVWDIPQDDAILPSHPRLVDSRAGYSLGRRLLRELAEWGPDSASVGEGLCLDLHRLIGVTSYVRHRYPPLWVAEAWDMLRDSCAEPVSIASVAAALGVHPVHLARTFREFYGTSPGERLRDWRVARAARLLRETRQPICDIALATGFADQSHFSKIFKRRYGVTPAAFRGI